MAMGGVALGRNDQALALLEQGTRERHSLMHVVAVRREFAPLRSEPRFQDPVRPHRHRAGCALKVESRNRQILLSWKNRRRRCRLPPDRNWARMRFWPRLAKAEWVRSTASRHAAGNARSQLKILPEGFAFDTERLARCRREAQVLASLNLRASRPSTASSVRSGRARARPIKIDAAA